MDPESVHIVDPRYKQELPKFTKIISHGQSVIDENKNMTHFVTDWKDDIRDIIIRVRAEII